MDHKKEMQKIAYAVADAVNPVLHRLAIAEKQLAAVREAISKQFTNSKHISYSQEYEAVADFANELQAAIEEQS